MIAINVIIKLSSRMPLSRPIQRSVSKLRLQTSSNFRAPLTLSFRRPKAFLFLILCRRCPKCQNLDSLGWIL